MEQHFELAQWFGIEFGSWSHADGFKYERNFETLIEDEGPGRDENGNVDSAYQEFTAKRLFDNMGGFGAGLGGTGKSHVQRRLVELFEEAGYFHYDRKGNKVSDVKICAYTHTAMANCVSLASHDAKTVMHLLHRYQK